MSKITKLQANFSLGEVSPKMYGSIDTEQYGAAATTCLNFIPLHLRCLARRPGTYFIKSVEDPTTISRAMPFQYSNTQSYVLEFSESGIRFYKDQGIILPTRLISNGTFTSTISPWSDVSDDGSVGASGGKMAFTAGMGETSSVQYPAISNPGDIDYTLTLDTFTNDIGVQIGTESDLDAYYSGTLSPGLAQSINFTSTNTAPLLITLGTTDVSAQADNIVLSTSEGYTIACPYLESEISELHYEQSFDVMYITHPSHKPKALTRYGHDNWSLADMAFDEPAWMDINKTDITLFPSGTTGTVTITASEDLFVSTDVGRAIRYKASDELIYNINLITYPGTGSQIYFDITFYPQTSDNISSSIIEADGSRTGLSYTSGTPGAGEFRIVNGQINTGDTLSTTQLIEIKQTNAGSGIWGWGTITGYVNGTSVSVSVQSDFAFAHESTQWRLGSWSVTTGYPKAVTLFEQRLWFGNTVAQPNTIWGSQTASFTNFQPDNIDKKEQVDADTSVTFTLNTPAVKWLKGTQALVIGCQNGVIQITGSNGAITAANNFTRKDLNIESSDVLPTVAYNTIVHVEHLQKRIHALSYALSTYGFQEADVSNFSDHLVRDDKIKQVAFSSTPNSIIWALTDDGRLLSCLFRPDKGLVGWSRHELGGTDVVIESMAVIPGADYSELWLVVTRSIDGDSAQYIEVLQADYEFQDQELAFYVDCGISFDGSPTQSFNGLDHLEGETLSVLADGAVHPDVVVSSGAITLDDDYSIVHVGLGYNSDFETLPISAQGQEGTTQPDAARIFQIDIKLYNSLNMLVGKDSTSLTRKTFRETSDNLGQAVPLFTGDYIFNYDGAFKFGDTKVFIRQDQPLPFTMLALICKLEINSK